jgi:hypothetical protein
MVLFAEIARRRRNDRALGDHEFLAGLNRTPNVIFTDEIERRLVCRFGVVLGSYWGLAGV